MPEEIRIRNPVKPALIDLAKQTAEMADKLANDMERQVTELGDSLFDFACLMARLEAQAETGDLLGGGL